MRAGVSAALVVVVIYCAFFAGYFFGIECAYRNVRRQLTQAMKS
jgi:hypothetical protein